MTMQARLIIYLNCAQTCVNGNFGRQNRHIINGYFLNISTYEVIMLNIRVFLMKVHACFIRVFLVLDFIYTRSIWWMEEAGRVLAVTMLIFCMFLSLLSLFHT